MVKKTRLFKTAALVLTVVMMMGMMAGCGGGGNDANNPPAANNNNGAAPAANDDKVYQIGVVQLMEHGALDSANKGFVDGLAAAGFVAGENIAFDQQNAQGDQSNLQTIAQRFVSSNVDLICAIATPAAQTVANATTEIPIVGTAITDYADAKLVESNEAPGTNVTGTSDMNPIAEQIDLLLKIVPEAKTIGTIYCSSEDNSILQTNIMKEYAASVGLTVEEATVSNVNDIQQAAQSLVTKGVQAIYVPTDNVLASAMSTLAAVTEEAKLPVICGEATMVENGGLATLGIDYYELGLQTGAMAARILKGEAVPAEMPIENSKNLAVAVNVGVAQRIGVEIPADVLEGAAIYGEEEAAE